VLKYLHRLQYPVNLYLPVLSWKMVHKPMNCQQQKTELQILNLHRYPSCQQHYLYRLQQKQHQYHRLHLLHMHHRLPILQR